MTHKQALAGNTAGLAPSGCSGALVAGGVFKDRHLEGTALVERTVTVFECAACGAVIPIAEGYILNAYFPYVCALAEKFEADAGQGGGGGEA